MPTNRALPLAHLDDSPLYTWRGVECGVGNEWLTLNLERNPQ